MLDYEYEWLEIAIKEVEADREINHDKDGNRIRRAVGENALWLKIYELLQRVDTLENELNYYMDQR
jgi:hypothetical protein